MKWARTRMPLPTPLGRPSRTPTTALFAFASLHTAQLRLAPSRRSSTSQRPRASSDGAEAFTNALPTREDQVALWAAAQFHEEVLDASGSPKETFSLVKACMLIALEEEASGGALGAPSSRTLADFTRNGDWSQPPMPRNEDGTHHGLGAAATWNLQRLDALAAEAASEFYRVCSDAGALGGVQAAVEAGADDSALLLAYADLVETFPTYMITAINTVLFERHGYRRMRRHGDPRDTSLGAVLEGGQGAPGTLAVLYGAVAERCALPLHTSPLDDGRYFVLWPTGASAALGAGGERFLIDPYAEGSFISEQEVGEMFGVDVPLRPATPAEVVAALLAPLRDAYWCKALECPPEPAFMVPIDPDLALGQYSDVSISYSSGEDDQEENSGFAKDGSGPLGMWPKAGLSLQRAVAAAQKRRWLLPNDPEAAMHLGVLRFFNKDYIMAQQELTRAAELAQGEEERATLSVLCEKARLLAQIENGRGDIE